MIDSLALLVIGHVSVPQSLLRKLRFQMTDSYLRYFGFIIEQWEDVETIFPKVLLIVVILCFLKICRKLLVVSQVVGSHHPYFAFHCCMKQKSVM